MNHELLVVTDITYDSGVYSSKIICTRRWQTDWDVSIPEWDRLCQFE